MAINSLGEAILNTNKGISNKNGDAVLNKVLYSPWSERYSKTIDDFYNTFIEKRLPDKDVALAWHNMLIDYSNKPGAVFPIRSGNTKGKLRRGWLVRVHKHDALFSYMFTDNDLAAYIYKIALDGYCPTSDEFYEYMTIFKAQEDIDWLKEKNTNNRKKKAKINNSIDRETGLERWFLSMPVHFNRIGGSGPDKTEDEKNAYINTSPAPSCCLGNYNYKHSHLIDVANMEYEIPKNGSYKFKDIKNFLLGTDENYKWDTTINNYAWNRIPDDNDEYDFDLIEKIIKAQFFRFLDPLNHFLAPMSEQNKYTRADGELSLDIAEYENLQKYIIFRKKESYNLNNSAFDKFIELTCAPKESSNIDIQKIGAEKIDIVYHEKSLSKTYYRNSKKISQQRRSNRTSNKTVKNISQNKSTNNSQLPKIVFDPANKDNFIKELLIHKKAERTWTYKDGTSNKDIWNAFNFQPSSNLDNNIKNNHRLKKEKDILAELHIKII